jgi:hypothetical protein
VTNQDRPPLDAAARKAKRARLAQMQGMDELFPEVHMSVEDVRLEYVAAAKKMWLWIAALVLTVLAGFLVQAIWILSLCAFAGAGFAWDVANERRSTYKRMLLEDKIEKSIVDHEAKTRV